MSQTRFHSLALALALVVTMACGAAGAGLPAPVAGISFDEWAAANARLARGAALDDVRKVLGVGDAACKSADAAFKAALRAGSVEGPVLRRYGEVFQHPDIGRFRAVAAPPVATGEPPTYEAWARVQGQLIAANEAKFDPATVPAENHLTAYEFSLAAEPWVRVLEKSAQSPWTPARVGWGRQWAYDPLSPKILQKPRSGHITGYIGGDHLEQLSEAGNSELSSSPRSARTRALRGAGS